jgi:hypothetical protein
LRRQFVVRRVLRDGKVAFLAVVLPRSCTAPVDDDFKEKVMVNEDENVECGIYPLGPLRLLFVGLDGIGHEYRLTPGEADCLARWLNDEARKIERRQARLAEPAGHA